MTLTQLCVSLELAKQLKEAGYPQEYPAINKNATLFYWRITEKEDISMFKGLK